MSVTGTYTGTGIGTFQLLVDGRVFASGTYACNGSGCTMTGTQLLGMSGSFTLTWAGLSDPARGNLSELFPTHGAWVSAVAKWAQANLTTLRVGQVVREAAARERGGRGNGRNK